MRSVYCHRQQVNEAVSRLKALGLCQLCIDDIRRGQVWQSRPRLLFDTLIGSASEWKGWGPESDAVADATRWLLDLDCDALIYHLVVNDAEFSDGSHCRMVHLLYVGGESTDWAYERPLRQDIKDPGTVFHIYCAAYNATYPELSDLGHIAVRSLAGGLVRLS